MLLKSCLAPLICLLLCSIAYAGQRIELIGVAEISGTASDLSGQADELENGEPHNRLGGFSALEYTGTGNSYVALPDRGPDDGATGYLCRFHQLQIDVDPTSTPAVTVRLKNTQLFTDQQGRNFTGASTAFAACESLGERLDPEGFRFAPGGHFFVSDEYGPQLIEFTGSGQSVRRLEVPGHLRIAHPADSKIKENELNTTGRSSNKGMEGLAISADGQTLWGIMQQVLLQDGVRDEFGKPIGMNCRLVRIDVPSGAAQEFVYQLDSTNHGLNEIVADGPDRFLVIERDSNIGSAAEFKRIMAINVSDATNVVDVDRLPTESLPDSIRPVKKETFVDFLDPQFQLTDEQIPEKLEGLTFGPKLADGRRTLLVSSDNDFNAETPTLIYVFALPQ